MASILGTDVESGRGLVSHASMPKGAFGFLLAAELMGASIKVSS